MQALIIFIVISSRQVDEKLNMNARKYSSRSTKNAQFVADLQTSCNKVVVKPILGCVRTVLIVPSVCDKSGTSCYHLVTWLMTVKDLLQVATRLLRT